VVHDYLSSKEMTALADVFADAAKLCFAEIAHVVVFSQVANPIGTLKMIGERLEAPSVGSYH
jgi:hypothetical protein